MRGWGLGEEIGAGLALPRSWILQLQSSHGPLLGPRRPGSQPLLPLMADHPQISSLGETTSFWRSESNT